MNTHKNIQADQAPSSLGAFERALNEADEPDYVLRLYVSGMTPNSRRAIDNTKKICEEYLNGRHELDIIDIYQQPVRAREDQIVAIPTLVKVFPLPVRKFIGDMSQTGRILAGLDIRKKNRNQPDER